MKKKKEQLQRKHQPKQKEAGVEFSFLCIWGHQDRINIT